MKSCLPALSAIAAAILKPQVEASPTCWGWQGRKMDLLVYWDLQWPYQSSELTLDHLAPRHLVMWEKWLSLWLVCSLFCLFVCLFVWSFWPYHTGCGILFPWPGIEPAPPAVEAWSLNHWTPREVLVCSFIFLWCICLKGTHKQTLDRETLSYLLLLPQVTEVWN